MLHELGVGDTADVTANPILPGKNSQSQADL